MGRPQELERDRKAEHIQLALQGRMQLRASTFDEYYFSHAALPEIDMAEIDTAVTFLGKELSAPLMISCMTGGTAEAARINRNLAAAAERTGIAIGVGSQRKALEDPSQVETFQVRRQAPSVPLLANLGAIQLNYGFGLTECQQAVRMIDGDALVLHLNPLQEALQPEGQVNFSNLLEQIGAIAAGLEVPVIAKEVGSGLSEGVARALSERGVHIMDTAGVGGTSWARIEGDRSGDVELGELFAGWGIPTPESIRQVSRVPGVTVIGSGGVRNGLDVAKAIALGASQVGMAYPFLRAALQSPDEVARKIEETVRELTIAMFCLGVTSIDALRSVPVHERLRA